MKTADIRVLVHMEMLRSIWSNDYHSPKTGEFKAAERLVQQGLLERHKHLGTYRCGSKGRSVVREFQRQLQWMEIENEDTTQG